MFFISLSGEILKGVTSARQLLILAAAHRNPGSQLLERRGLENLGGILKGNRTAGASHVFCFRKVPTGGGGSASGDTTLEALQASKEYPLPAPPRHLALGTRRPALCALRPAPCASPASPPRPPQDGRRRGRGLHYTAPAPPPPCQVSIGRDASAVSADWSPTET